MKILNNPIDNYDIVNKKYADELKPVYIKKTDSEQTKIDKLKSLIGSELGLTNQVYYEFNKYTYAPLIYANSSEGNYSFTFGITSHSKVNDKDYIITRDVIVTIDQNNVYTETLEVYRCEAIDWSPR